MSTFVNMVNTGECDDIRAVEISNLKENLQFHAHEPVITVGYLTRIYVFLRAYFSAIFRERENRKMCRRRRFPRLWYYLRGVVSVYRCPSSSRLAGQRGAKYG